MTGVAVAAMSLDVHWHDTYFVVRPFPLHHGRRHAHRVPGRAPLLVSEDDRAHVFGAHGGCSLAIVVFTGFFVTFVPQFILGNGGCRGAITITRRSSRCCTSSPPLGSWLLGAGLLNRLRVSVLRRVLGTPRRQTTRGARARSSGARRLRRPSTTSTPRPTSRLAITITPSPSRTSRCLKP